MVTFSINLPVIISCIGVDQMLLAKEAGSLSVCVCVIVLEVPKTLGFFQKLSSEGAQALFCPVREGCFVDNVSKGWGG